MLSIQVANRPFLAQRNINILLTVPSSLDRSKPVKRTYCRPRKRSSSRREPIQPSPDILSNSIHYTRASSHNVNEAMGCGLYVASYVIDFRFSLARFRFCDFIQAAGSLSSDLSVPPRQGFFHCKPPSTSPCTVGCIHYDADISFAGPSITYQSGILAKN